MLRIFMIYKIEFEDGRIDWCTAESILHLLKSYDKEYDLPLQEIEDIQEINDNEAQTIVITNVDWDEDCDEPETFNLYDLAVGDEFQIIASTEFV